MTENQRGQSSMNMQTAERCTSPQNSVGIRKSARLLKPSLLHTHQDSAPSTSSNRLPSPTAEETAGESNASTSNAKETTTPGKQQRKGKVWELATENLFYDALKMHGKDYDAIVKYITKSKSKSKSLPSSNVKNYEQVRNYYHNTTTKILALLDLPEIDVSKEVKELFALINYGEWKRKTNNLKLTSKYLKYFRSLVMDGYTVIKLRGSTKPIGKKKRPPCTIRTPMCSALRKLLEGRDDIPIDTSVPKTITVELSPNNQRDRAYVLGCWQNPFIRFELGLNQAVNEWLRWLQNKWIPQDLKARKSLLGDDISNELADIVLYPSPDTVLRTVKLNPAGPKSISASIPSNNSAQSTFSSTSLNFGLRHYCDSKSGSSSNAKPDQWPPLSPGKNDRKRRKSTPVVNEAEQQTSVVDGGNSKRFRPDLASPTPDDGAEIRNDTARQSDGGDGESSCDACPPSGAPVEGDIESGNEQKQPVQIISMQSPEEHGSAVEKPDLASVKDNSKQQPHSILLNPDLLRNGLSPATCGPITVGQLCLMCDKARIIRLKYTIAPKSTQNLVNAADSWNFFINLVRSSFMDPVSKKTAPSSSVNRVVLSSIASAPTTASAPPPQYISSPTEMDNVASAPMVEGSDLAMYRQVDMAIEEQQRRQQKPQQQRADIPPDYVFATPHAVGQTKKKALAKAEATNIGPPPATPMTRDPYDVGNAGILFLQQMGNMINSPLHVNRRPAVLNNKPAGKVPIAPLRQVATSAIQNQRPVVLARRPVVLVPATTGSPAPTATLQQGTTIGQAISNSEIVHASVQLSIESQYSSSILHSEIPSTSAIVESTNTLNTPDVSLLRASPEPVPEAAIIVEAVSEPAYKEPDSVGIPVSVAASAPPPQQDIISSDSFLDFSLGSFPAFGMKSLGTPKKAPMLNVIHSLRLDSDDSALSSPPRPIRNATISKEDTKSAYQPGVDPNLFPSTSNLFPLLDASIDNESSNTRNYFAACSMASALNTPEKCKDDERR